MIWQKFTNDIEGSSGRDCWRRSDSGGRNSWSGIEKYLSLSRGHGTSSSGIGYAGGGTCSDSGSGKKESITSGSGNMEKRW